MDKWNIRATIKNTSFISTFFDMTSLFIHVEKILSPFD